MASLTAPEPLQKTPLNAVHRALGARMVDFGGWDMPVEYSGIIDEHLAVRNAVGLFDVSHMGEIELRGPQAFHLVDGLTPNAVARLEDGQAHYSALLYPNGTFVDDILVHRMGPEHYFLCVNASNQRKDFEWIESQNHFDAEVEFASEKYVQLAIQGPRAIETLGKLTTTDLAAIGYYWFERGQALDVPAIIARTGYTGEDGFEIYVAPEQGARLWNAILEAGEEFGIKPCGLGARNTLRLEAAMSLYGHEIDDTITPYEARLGWIVKLKKGEFVGRDALLEQKEKGLTRRLAGLEMTGRGIGRDGYRVFDGDRDIGWVTSGSLGPYVGKNIALAMLSIEKGEPGTEVEVDVRGRKVGARVTPTPFYSRKK
ncbi:MAG TPA: glycine cleavage system aminomethyltransferase GcvT [Bryobacterales bacterium]|nr:glycine cleavage system aminomethyltransferase GcvT [Bryobacterales bacterium]